MKLHSKRVFGLALASFGLLLVAEILAIYFYPVPTKGSGAGGSLLHVAIDHLPIPKFPHRKARRPESAWAAIDQHALAAPAHVEKSIPELAAYLFKPACDDWEKVRAIFRWMSDRIKYDDVAFNSGKYGLENAQALLVLRSGVCEDYANLFNALAKEANIPSKKVVGFSKGFEYLVTKHTLEPDHAWNAFYVDGGWHLMDVTWAYGYGTYVKKRLRTTKKFEPRWFDTPPVEFVFKHLPSEGRWQLLNRSLSLSEFECLPNLPMQFFDIGFDSEKLLASFRKGEVAEVAKLFEHPFELQVKDVPVNRYIPLGDSLQLQLVCENCKTMAAQTGGRMLTFEKMDSLFCLDIKPKKGTLRIFGQKNGSGRKYDGIFEYIVQKEAVRASCPE